MSRTFLSLPLTRKTFFITLASFLILGSVAVSATELLAPPQYKISSAANYWNSKLTELVVKPIIKPVTLQSTSSSSSSQSSQSSSLASSSEASSSSLVNSSSQSSVTPSTPPNLPAPKTFTYTDPNFSNFKLAYPSVFGINVTESTDPNSAFSYKKEITLKSGNQSLSVQIYFVRYGGGRIPPIDCGSNISQLPPIVRLNNNDIIRFQNQPLSSEPTSAWQYSLNHRRFVFPVDPNFDATYTAYVNEYQGAANAPTPIAKSSVAFCDTHNFITTYTATSSHQVPVSNTGTAQVLVMTNSTDAQFLNQCDEIMKSSTF